MCNLYCSLITETPTMVILTPVITMALVPIQVMSRIIQTVITPVTTLLSTLIPVTAMALVLTQVMSLTTTTVLTPLTTPLHTMTTQMVTQIFHTPIIFHLAVVMQMGILI